MIMNLAVPRLARIEQRGFLIKPLLLKRSPGFLKMSVMTQGCGMGTLTRVLFLIPLQNACFSTSRENADLALRMWVLFFIAINENWLKGIDSCLGNLMREFSRSRPLFQCSLTCQPQTVHKLRYCFSPISV